ncbi:glycosyltransferase family 4 protein [Pseudomonas putida]|uniref:glycosyltransferase family 4 protein n=1 Tax=Pseudomonas putida TaxID=303 RepID=UPI001A8CB309|nr:glycosyltransferase family 4 protein [Pseudomonas putida]MBO0368801.1 glycosyltransferase family 4 protein [Pseudomonas putida]
MKKRILLLTFFFPPDLSAGSFRAQALLDAMRLQAGEDVEIDVLTTQPNRYDSHITQAASVEQVGRIRITRIQLPPHKSGFIDQSRAFLWFAHKSTRLARSEQYDVVIATSSRLMTAVLGTWIARQQKAKLYLDLRDLFVKNIQELFTPVLSKPLSWFFSCLERWAVGNASKVNLVSCGFLDYFSKRYPDRQFSLYTNGVDKEFIDFPMAPPAVSKSPDMLRILYAGNVGDGQGLHLIIPELARRLEGKAFIQIVGAGSRLELLRKEVDAAAVTNVELVTPIPRKDLLGLYRSSDVLFLHLNSHNSFRRVLPSKLFEYAATGKPIWAGATGYAAEFINKEVSNSAVFSPCDTEGALASLESLRLEQVSRPEFIERFSRNRIMRPMASEILKMLD